MNITDVGLQEKFTFKTLYRSDSNKLILEEKINAEKVPFNDKFQFNLYCPEVRENNTPND